MTTAVRLQATQGAGFLILTSVKPNIFVDESVSMTAERVERDYGCLVKANIHVSSTEYRRFRRECGV